MLDFPATAEGCSRGVYFYAVRPLYYNGQGKRESRLDTEDELSDFRRAAANADDLNAPRYETRWNNRERLARNRCCTSANYSHRCTIEGDELMTFQLMTIQPALAELHNRERRRHFLVNYMGARKARTSKHWHGSDPRASSFNSTLEHIQLVRHACQSNPFDRWWMYLGRQTTIAGTSCTLTVQSTQYSHGRHTFDSQSMT